jgi:hypothetical protein
MRPGQCEGLRGGGLQYSVAKAVTGRQFVRDLSELETGAGRYI